MALSLYMMISNGSNIVVADSRDDNIIFIFIIAKTYTFIVGGHSILDVVVLYNI